MTAVRADTKVIVGLDLSNIWTFGGSSDFDYDFNFNFPPVNTQSPRIITRQTFSFSTSNSPGPQSAGRGLSPFSQYVNLEVFDIRPEFQIMANLPYFRLQSMLDRPGMRAP